MTAMLTAGDVLLREVLECPGDDTPRLVLADWLEEHGEADRAEFIRVQVELAGIRVCESDRLPTTEAAYRRSEWLKRRAWELLNPDMARRREWIGPFAGAFHECLLDGWHGNGRGSWPWCRFRRGFIDSAALACRDFLAHAAALFAAHPVTEVRLTDRVPLELPGDGWWAWLREGAFPPHGGDSVPACLFGLLGGEEYAQGRARFYADEGEAHADLSRAAVTLGRDLNRLPRLP